LNDQSRDDAVAVYRWLSAVRAEGGATAEEIAFQCFPLPTALSDPDVTLPEAVVRRLRRLPVSQVLEAVNYLRAHGVGVRCVAGVRVTDGEVMGSVFALTV
jgi:hypothetical protein